MSNPLGLKDRDIEQLADLLDRQDLPFDLVKAHAFRGETDEASCIYAKLEKDALELLETMTPAELTALMSSLPNFVQFAYQTSVQYDIKRGLTRVASGYVEFYVSRVPKNLDQLIKIDSTKSKYAANYPQLLKQLDADKLLPIQSPDFAAYEGVLIYQPSDSVFRVHPLLRHYIPAYSSSGFAQRIDDLITNNPKATVLLALDFDHVITQESYWHPFEKAFGHGSKFDLSRVDKLQTKGTSVYRRESGTDYEFSLLGLDKVEAYWSIEDQIATVQIEEIFEVSAFPSRVLARYIHAERNTQNQTWTHLDGAISIYPIAEYAKRRSQSFPNEYRAPEKIKLFRVDGQFSDEAWLELVEGFFANNELVSEYLRGE
jgi:hypothetical protein